MVQAHDIPGWHMHITSYSFGDLAALSRVLGLAICGVIDDLRIGLALWEMSFGAHKPRA